MAAVVEPSLHKICKKCQRSKTIENFYKKRKGQLGVDSLCIPCTSLKKKQAYVMRKRKKIQEQVSLHRIDYNAFPYCIKMTIIKAENGYMNQTMEFLISSVNARRICLEREMARVS
ncbi:MAG: hypothetical protein HYW48_02540 [Deltaproteobacteria bacterium]|nr:hypothetical protein [Deltaproteobacteria bacterium]